MVVAQGCDAVILMAAHDEYREMDLDELQVRVGRPILIDGRNVFAPGQARTAGWDYRGVGRG